MEMSREGNIQNGLSRSLPRRRENCQIYAWTSSPDASGIGYYDEDLFLQAIRTGKLKARALSPIMPWYFYRQMTDEDLKAIFAYLRTLKQVKHTVDNTESPTACRLCGLKHGGGEKN